MVKVAVNIVTFNSGEDIAGLPRESSAVRHSGIFGFMFWTMHPPTARSMRFPDSIST
jgi:hypothetical protein